MVILGLLDASIGTIIWTSVAFLIVAFLLKKMAWKPILKSLNEREEFIEKSLKSAEKAREEMARLKSDNEALMAEARAEREKILKEAREIKEIILNDARLAASKEGDRLINNARTEIEKEKTNAMSDIKRQVAALSVEIAEKVLRKEFEDKSKQESLVQEHLERAQLS